LTERDDDGRARGTRPAFSEHDYAQLAASAAAGARLQDVALRVGLGSRRALSRRFEQDERAAEAWALGRAELHEKLVSTLISKALNGEVVPLLFLLKTQYGYREGEPLDGGDQRSLVTINLPAAVAPEAWAKLIEVKPLPVAAGTGNGSDV
jgi:hypothetical protein